MKASLSWLNQYVSIDMDVEALADALTMAGLEVEAITDRYAYLNSVVSGRITRIDPHPNADSLTVCMVDVGQQSLSIVCGAPNVKEGMVVPVALAGTQLPGGISLEKRAVRGVSSNGMLCSEAELELGVDGSGIMVLDPDAALGVPLPTLLQLSDTMLEIDLTPNRSDCLSLIGIAREIAAIQGSELRQPDIRMPEMDGSISDLTSVQIDAPDDCPRYAARLLTGVTVAPSPFWLQDRLSSVGMRPINNIVDITNFVMMETGQPLHAFDFDRLAQNRIVVRLAKAGESFTTLDEKQHTLIDSMLMICDGDKPVALAGVMGGLNSEIEAGSTSVLIESACFNAITIRKAAKTLGIHSEASHRFERGVDPDGTLFALNRAAQLMAEIGGGRLLDGTVDQHPRPTTREPIRLGVVETNRFLGTDLSLEKMADLLRSIEFDVDLPDPSTLIVIPPSFRVDIHRPVDLMEEVARLWGYNNIATTYPLTPAKAKPMDSRLSKRQLVKRSLISLGLSEAINYSFIHSDSTDRIRLTPADPKRQTVSILNPLSEGQSVMRTSLLPGLLETMGKNLAQQNLDLKLFEIGHVFLPKGDGEQPEEIEMLTGLWTGAREESSWYGRRTECDFYDIKGVVEGLFDGLNVGSIRFTGDNAESCPYLQPGHAALIQVEREIVGSVGQVHPDVLSNYALKQIAFVFELNLELLYRHMTDDVAFSSISPYPATSRDVTLIVDRDVESRALLESVQTMEEPLVEALRFFDIFEGDPIAPGKKSVSFRIVYRSDAETLADNRINAVHRKLTEGLLEAFNATFPT